MLKIEIEQENFIIFNPAEITFEIGSEDLSIKYTVVSKIENPCTIEPNAIGYWLFKFYF